MINRSVFLVYRSIFKIFVFSKKFKVSKNLNQTDLNRQNQEPIFQSCVGAAETRVLPGHTHPLTEKWVRKPSIRAAMPTEY
jgi:hypothetical protein